MAKRFLNDVTIDGKLGVGETTPLTDLHVTGGDQAILRLEATTGSYPSSKVQLFENATEKGEILFSSIGGGLILQTVNTNRLVIGQTEDSGVQIVNADFKVNNSTFYVDKGNSRVGVNQSSPSYDLDVTGDGRFTGKIYFANMFSQISDLPSATTYHGMFAHVHATGKAYYAHGGNWIELANNSDINPAANNSTITLTAGTGISGGGDFTTDQSSAETITFNLADTAVTPGQYGDASNTPQITVDQQGRITSIGTVSTTGSGGGGSGSTTISVDAFNGDGNTTAFTLSNTITSEDNTQVYVDGVYQSKDTYSTSGTTLTFSEAPPTGTGNVEVVHLQAVSVSSTSGVTQNSFTGDGTTTAFTLSQSPTDENFTFVFIQGVYQDKSTYSLSGSTLTFSTAPQNGYGVEVMAIGAVNIQQTSYLEYDNFTGNGSTTSFNLANGSPSDEKFTMVYIQGVYQEKSTYSLSSGNVVFSTAPQNGYTIEVMSINGGGIQAAQSYTATETAKANVQVISADTTAAGHNYLYVFTASLTLTLPASPEVGDSIKISNRSGAATCVLGANGNKIMGAAADLTLDTASASFELIYSGTDQGWVIIGQ